MNSCGTIHGLTKPIKRYPSSIPTATKQLLSEKKGSDSNFTLVNNMQIAIASKHLVMQIKLFNQFKR